MREPRSLQGQVSLREPRSLQGQEPGSLREPWSLQRAGDRIVLGVRTSAGAKIAAGEGARIAQDRVSWLQEQASWRRKHVLRLQDRCMGRFRGSGRRF